MPQQVSHARMGGVPGAEYRDGLGVQVRFPGFCDVQDGENHLFAVTQRERSRRPGCGGYLLWHVEGHWDWPQGSVGKAHRVTYSQVVVPSQEAFERREAATCQ